MSSGPGDDQPFPDVAGRPARPLDAASWDERWRNADAPWDMGGPAPPLSAALARGDLKPPARVLVPGCGSGHDALLLAARGFDVVAVDVSPAALDRARRAAEEARVPVSFLEADVLALPRAPSPLHAGFDAVWEHTCFCAIDPARRDEYVDAVADALRPGGRLLGLFFAIAPETGPPFGTTEREVRCRFARRFAVDELRAALDSHPARLGRELWASMTRR